MRTAVQAAELGEQNRGHLISFLDQYGGDLALVYEEIQHHHPTLASEDVAEFVKRGRRGEKGSMILLHHSRSYFTEYCMMPLNFTLEALEKWDTHMREFVESGGRAPSFDERCNALISILPPEVRPEY